jgi:hypothetical protein
MPINDLSALLIRLSKPVATKKGRRAAALSCSNSGYLPPRVVGFVVEPPIEEPLPGGSAVSAFGIPVEPGLSFLVEVGSVLLPERAGAVLVPPVSPFIIVPEVLPLGALAPLPETGGGEVLCATAIDDTPTNRTADMRILEIIAVPPIL